MDIEERFVSKALPEPVTLLGQRLKPYSIGHELILQRFRNPFVFEGSLPDIDDLFFAIFVCCSPYEEALSEMDRSDLGRTIRRWVKKTGDFDFIGVVSEFNKYRLEAIEFPPHRRKLKQREYAKMNTPLLFFMLYILCSELHMSLSDAINLPFGLAIIFYLIHFEKSGTVGLKNIEDGKVLEEIKRRMAEDGLEPMRVNLEDN